MAELPAKLIQYVVCTDWPPGQARIPFHLLSEHFPTIQDAQDALKEYQSRWPEAYLAQITMERVEAK